METINQISIESFSYGWLNNINPTFEFDRLEESRRRSFEALDGGSFIEMDPDFFSIRWTDPVGFDFSLSSGYEPSNLVHADQIFSNGQLLPLSTLKKKEACFSSDSIMTRSVSIDCSKTLLSERDHWDDSVSTNTSPAHCSSHCMPLNNGGRELKQPFHASAWKILRKYTNFMIPLYNKVKKMKMVSLGTTRSCGHSTINSTKSANGFSNIDRNRVSDWEFESSIYDAVLHCKKSIAKA